MLYNFNSIYAKKTISLELMLRATSIVNFLNQANFLAIDQKSQNVIWRFNANSFKLWLSHSSKNFDSFNKGSPAYKYVHYDRGVKNFFF